MAKEEMPKVGEKKELALDAATTEFKVRKSELMADMKAGSFGRVVIPVRVMDIGDGFVYFQKDGEVKVDGEFSDQEPLESMKKRIGVAEDR
jgi:hypothetical protein